MGCQSSTDRRAETRAARRPGEPAHRYLPEAQVRREEAKDRGLSVPVTPTVR
ncbi:MAG: hypothetical protein QM658_05380 [Gordonia sp. (in: high G+C Gram-positive bacteria)]